MSRGAWFLQTRTDKKECQNVMGMEHISRQETRRDSCESGNPYKLNGVEKSREDHPGESHQARNKLWTLARASWCGSGVIKQKTSAAL